MQSWKKALALAVVLAAAGACSQSGEPTAPEAGPRFDGQAPSNGTGADSTGRWGGYIGGGG